MLGLIAAAIHAPSATASFHRFAGDLFAVHSRIPERASTYFDVSAADAPAFGLVLEGEHYLVERIPLPGGELEDYPGGSAVFFRLHETAPASFLAKYGNAVRGLVYDRFGTLFSLEGYGNGLTIERAHLRPHCSGEPPRVGFIGEERPAAAEAEVRYRKRRASGSAVAIVRYLAVDEEGVVAAQSEEVRTAYHLAAVAQVNAVLLDSGIWNGRVVLAGVASRGAPKEPKPTSTLLAFANDMAVDAARRAFEADIVGFRTKDAGNMALAPTRESEFRPHMGFFIYGQRLALETGTIVHEFGHTLGMLHEWTPSRAAKPDEFGFNYAFHAADNSYATLMANDAGPDGRFPTFLPVFSAERVWKGKRIGDATARNADMGKIGITLVSRYAERLAGNA